MKNIFNPETQKELLSRVDKLTPQTKAVWGKMNVNQALRHMALAFEIPTGELNPTVVRVPPMPKWLLKYFLINAKPPKGKAETFKEMNMVANNINPAEFEAERAMLKKKILDFLLLLHYFLKIN